MRGIFSASFTANKLKLLFQIMDNCGKNFVQHFLEKQKNLIELDMQDAFTRYTNDVIAATVFGAEINSLKEPDNEFYLRGKEATDFSQFPANIKLLMSVLCPSLFKVIQAFLISYHIIFLQNKCKKIRILQFFFFFNFGLCFIFLCH